MGLLVQCRLTKRRFWIFQASEVAKRAKLMPQNWGHYRLRLPENVLAALLTGLIIISMPSPSRLRLIPGLFIVSSYS